jgi:hypothetical protein
MPVTPTTTTIVYGAADAKISKLLTDPSGGSATYATSIDVPGIKSIEITAKTNSKELRGDNKLLDSIQIVDSLEVKVTFAKWDQNLYALFSGATVTTDTTTGNSTATLLGATVGSYFKLDAVSVKGEGAASNVQITLPKCIASSLPNVSLAEEDYATFEVTLTALPRNSDNQFLTFVYNTTAATLS